MLAHLMEVRGLTKAKVAKATGIAPQTIAKLLNDSEQLGKTSRAKLARFFHVSPELFLAAK